MAGGGFQNNPFMRMTLWLTTVFLAGFVVTNFMLYFAKMDLTPSSVISYYNGSEEEFRPARSYQSMLEVTHGHLPMMALVLLLLTHLVIFAPYSRGGKTVFILTAFLSGLVRFAHTDFAYLKIFSFCVLQASLLFLLTSLTIFLYRSSRDEKDGTHETDKPTHRRLSTSEYIISSQNPDASQAAPLSRNAAPTLLGVTTHHATSQS
jgi:hypothetical protein